MAARDGAGAIVLAAGSGSRFGGHKLLAELDGKPLLQHVLDAAAQARLEPVIVVMGADARRLEAAISWRAELRVINAAPERGLSSSLQAGIEALEEAAPTCRRALVLLADQPRLRPAQVRALLRAPPDPARPIVAPRYEDGQPGSPVLLEREAWPLATLLEGDRGMSQLFETRLELVRYVDVPGSNPDVDTVTDLAALSPSDAPQSRRRTKPILP